MTRIILSLVLAAASLAAGAQVKFNPDGKFKIVQFTDLHMKYGNPKSEAAVECIQAVLEAEKPDLVVVTGDLVFAAPAREGLDAVLKPVLDSKTPFIVTLGNHDDEQDMTRDAIYAHIRSMKGCIQPEGENYTLIINDSQDRNAAALLYCMDSHAYTPVQGMGKYAWHTFDQLEWYRNESARHTAQNGGDPLPALAFFHIPLFEFAQASVTDGQPLVGTRRERVCCGAVSSGLFALMRQMGDVAGIFVGHDHDNDYSTLFHGILLAYGRYSGGDTVYNNLANGARVIELTQGQRSFSTWIRLRTGQVLDTTVCPTSYTRK